MIQKWNKDKMLLGSFCCTTIYILFPFIKDVKEQFWRTRNGNNVCRKISGIKPQWDEVERKSVFFLLLPTFTFLLGKKQTTGTSFSTQTTISSVGTWTREMSVWTIHIEHLKRLAGLGSINHTNLNPGYTLLINNSCLLSKAAWNIVRYIIPIMFYMLSLSNGNMKMFYF